MEEKQPENLQQIIAQNQIVLEKVERRLDRIEKHFTWNTIFGFIKAIIIIGPLVFGIIYLSPFLKTYISTIQPFLQSLNINNLKYDQADNSAGDANLLTPQIKSVLCNQQTLQALVKQNCPSN